jgi:serine/threonine protein kinase
MLQDRDSAKGTPLWMAPEVMNFLQFNEKADVYSFGIVLWELLTRDEPFNHHNNFEKFKRAVCIQRERPPIPETCPDSLRNLIEECWAHNASIRPSFEEIIPRLNEATVDVSIVDAVGRQFWKENFIDVDEVDWTDFAWKMFQKIGVPDNDTLSSDQISQSIQNARCLKAMLVTQTKSKTENREVVDIENFGNFCEWFGPIGEPEITPWNENILDNVRETLKHEWFHGDIPQKRCEALLMTQPGGTFLIRYSSRAGWFCLSQVGRDGKIKHQRIKHSPGTGYTFSDNEFPTLIELVNGNSLNQPCPGSFYQSLFQDDPEGVYEQYD